MKMMRLVCAVFAILVVFACQEKKNKIPEQQVAPVEIEQHESVPEAMYEDLAGNPVQLVDYKGKRVLLNYWATWCKPCIEEMPELERLQGTLSTEDYVFLFASDQSHKKIKKFQEAKKFDLTFIKFNGSWADKDIMALPVTVIYNTEGEQVARFDGAENWNSPEMVQKLKSL